MTLSLDQRTVLLTGVAGDIGVAYLQGLVGKGANVVATDLPALGEIGEELVRKANQAGPGEAIFVGCDITQSGEIDTAVKTAVERFGGLHSVINNAAIYKTLGSKRSLMQLSNEDWDLVLKVNVRGSWQVIKSTASVLASTGEGRIVNISSVVARNGAPGFAHYVASKAAVEGLTRAAARELGSNGITVNCVAPGLVDDEATRSLNTEDYLTMASRARALPRTMVPDDLVGAVLWLAGPDSGFVTGQVIIVDGGGVFS